MVEPVKSLNGYLDKIKQIKKKSCIIVDRPAVLKMGRKRSTRLSPLLEDILFYQHSPTVNL